jgi:hypothetical protein
MCILPCACKSVMSFVVPRPLTSLATSYSYLSDLNCPPHPAPGHDHTSRRPRTSSSPSSSRRRAPRT